MSLQQLWRPLYQEVISTESTYKHPVQVVRKRPYKEVIPDGDEALLETIVDEG